MNPLPRYFDQIATRHRIHTTSEDATGSGFVDRVALPSGQPVGSSVDELAAVLERYFETNGLVLTDLFLAGDVAGWASTFESVTGSPLAAIVEGAVPGGGDPPEPTFPLIAERRDLGAIVDDSMLDRVGGSGVDANYLADVLWGDAFAPGPEFETRDAGRLFFETLQWSMIQSMGLRAGQGEIVVEPSPLAITLATRSPVPAHLMWDSLVNRLVLGARQRHGQLTIPGFSNLFRSHVLEPLDALEYPAFPENHAHFSGTIPQRFVWIAALFKLAGFQPGSLGGLPAEHVEALFRWCRYVLFRLNAHADTIDEVVGSAVDDARTVRGYDEAFAEHWSEYQVRYQRVETHVRLGDSDRLGLYAAPFADTNFEALERRMVGSGVHAVDRESTDSAAYRRSLLFSYLWIRSWFHRNSTHWIAAKDAGLPPFMQRYRQATWATSVEDTSTEQQAVEALENRWGMILDAEMRRLAEQIGDPFRAVEVLYDVLSTIVIDYADTIQAMGQHSTEIGLPADSPRDVAVIEHALEHRPYLRHYLITFNSARAVLGHALANRISSLELRTALPGNESSDLDALLAHFLPMVRAFEEHVDRTEAAVSRMDHDVGGEHGLAISRLWPDMEPGDATEFPSRFGIVLTLLKGGKHEWASDRHLQDQFDRLRLTLEHLPEEVLDFVVGIDAAASEWGAAPYLFQRHYRLADEHRLGKTFHAGEDYGDLLTGLRYIHEAINVLGCSRIGHGLALGDDPAEFYTDATRIDERVDRVCEMDGTVHAADGAATFGGYVEDLLDTARWLDDELDVDATPYVEALDGASLPLLDSYARESDRTEDLDLARPVILQGSESIVDLAGSVKTEVFELVSDADVTVEACPQSNRVIGHLDSMAGHPCLTVFPRKGVGCCVNTDDLGVFNTSLPVEFWRLYRHRRSVPNAWNDLLETWITTGRDASFIP